MKLIDLLVQELPKRGGWPEGVAAMAQDFDGDVQNYADTIDIKLGTYASGSSRIHGSYSLRKIKAAEDRRNAFVTREQYESALAAAQWPVWDGEGLPPVGCECEAKYRDAANAEWFFFRCVGVDCGIAFGWAGKDAVTLDKGTFEFRPIHSEADKRRDDVIESIFDILNDYDFEVVHIRGDQKRMATDIVERIASGMIPHIRIE
ncbi:hypothetical protein VEL46_004109 [Cronobacter sakazakii]|nr:hypothetical protein [Cronobacter sakazakii]EJA3082670.1 hypothetical protein [Cronobacter sakazakii]EJA3123099.1 hypothetical protein [Cronobacter sakazakii]EJC8204198.1 hypothetical protein [Cronobacter sakazakii]EJC8208183.1 hypothetical protein [Cronobacter sakazakii]